MSFKWGNTQLNVYRYSYKPPHCVPTITETPLLAGADNIKPATSLQQGGRSRKRTSFSGYVQSWPEYESLLNDWNECIERTFEAPDGVILTMMIEDLKEPTMINSFKYEISMSLMEV